MIRSAPPCIARPRRLRVRASAASCTSGARKRCHRIANALRGDVILSRSCGYIGGLLAKVSPAQKWSHSGIMTENYVRIRQSTGIDEYMKDHPNGDFDHADRRVRGARAPLPVARNSRLRGPAGLRDRDRADRSGRQGPHGQGIQPPRHPLRRGSGARVSARPQAERGARSRQIRPLLHQLADAARAGQRPLPILLLCDASAVEQPEPAVLGQLATRPRPSARRFLWRAAQARRADARRRQDQQQQQRGGRTDHPGRPVLLPRRRAPRRGQLPLQDALQPGRPGGRAGGGRASATSSTPPSKAASDRCSPRASAAAWRGP